MDIKSLVFRKLCPKVLLGNVRSLKLERWALQYVSV